MKVPKILWHSKISSWVTVTVLAGIVNFLHRSSHDAMILIFDDDSDANTLMSRLLMSSAYTKLWTVQLFMLSCQWGAQHAQGAGNGQSQDRWLRLKKKKKKGHSYHVVLCWTIKAGIKKEKGGNFGNDGICFPKTIHAHEFSALLCARSFYFT